MSHTVDVSTKITDEECLVKALCRVENQTGHIFPASIIERHKDPTLLNLYGSHRTVNAHIIIRRPNLGHGAYNDLGFVKNSDGSYTAVIADKYDSAWLQRLTTYYGVEKAKKEFKARGIKYTETTDDKGRVQLKAQVKGGIYG